ncbi:MAG TPA: TIGR04104 family putative zinc finger protein [Sporosarcina sp.]|nr:TIGR04104 family putative zinc finger protein [Sporosarcina sp.]
MPTCEYCKKTWTWKETIQKTTSLNPALSCPYCRQIQYQTKHSRMQMSMLPMMSLFPLILSIFVDLPTGVTIGFILLLSIFAFVIYPFFIRIGNEEESIIP